MEGPASDGDSGHTDSEGSVGSMDTMSRESNTISIAIMLCMVCVHRLSVACSISPPPPPPPSPGLLWATITSLNVAHQPEDVQDYCPPVCNTPV